MPLTKEQSLIPRYKVKDKYPGMEAEPFHLGQIITLQWHREEDGEFSKEGFIHVPIKHMPRSFMWQSFFDLYPNIFKPLPWWSDRSLEDMPEYLRIIERPTLVSVEIGSIVKVFKHFTSSFGEPNKRGCQVFGRGFMSYSRSEPATKEEYTAYINQINK